MKDVWHDSSKSIRALWKGFKSMKKHHDIVIPSLVPKPHPCGMHPAYDASVSYYYKRSVGHRMRVMFLPPISGILVSLRPWAKR